MCVKARDILHSALTPPGAIFHFPDCTFYFIFFFFSSTSILSHMGSPSCLYSASTLPWAQLSNESVSARWLAVGLQPGTAGALRNCLGVWNTLMAIALKVPWCSWRSRGAFDTPSSFKILFDIWDVDLFLSAFPEMNLFHLVITFFFFLSPTCLCGALESY